MIIAVLALLAGFAGLLWSADRFISGAASTACHVGVRPLLIGLTVVSLGTSAPELLVSAGSALLDAGEIAIGNAIGSNLANIGMVLGITLLLIPIPVKGYVVRREMPLVLLATILAAAVFADNQLTRVEGLLLLTGFCVSFALFFHYDKNSIAEGEDVLQNVVLMPPKRAVVWLLIGLILLCASAELLVWGGINLAESLGVSQLVIGLTVIAIGTSLPELAASAISAWRGHHEIALGTILGSNLFNLLAVTGVASTIQPLSLDPAVLYRDYLVMTLATILLAGLLWISYLRRKSSEEQARLGRIAGILLLLCYLAYYAILFADISS